jgi:vanillin dehydrogenase
VISAFSGPCQGGERGAKITAGGRLDGTVMTATVLDCVTPAMRIYSEESFGPVVCVVRATGADDAVRIADDTEYRRSATVFGPDVAAHCQ